LAMAFHSPLPYIGFVAVAGQPNYHFNPEQQKTTLTIHTHTY
jgi:hypothetical protein